MKKNLKFYMLALLVPACVLMCTKTTNGQVFQAASATEYAGGPSSIGPYNTGNDILKVGSSDIYRVSVWSEGSHAGILWDVNIGTTLYQGYTTFSTSSNISHADVCLVEDAGAGKVYALAAWHVVAGGGLSSFYVEVFEWDVTNHNFYSNSSNWLGYGNFGTTLNIDGDDVGDWAIVFDRGGNIYGVEGTMISTFTINVGVTYLVAGSYPDVCIFSDFTSTQRIRLVYIDGSGNLLVKGYTMSFGSGTTLLSATAPQSDHEFSNPRIACRNSSGDIDEWAVVLEEIKRSSPADYLIEGFISDNGGSVSGPLVFNDGNSTYSVVDLTDAPNLLPVVAYDSYVSSTQNIWVGWIMDNSAPTYGYSGQYDALYPIVLKCDNTLTPLSTAAYWNVPTTLSNGDAVGYLSLSGRYAGSSNDLYLSYHGVNSSPRMHTKWVASNSASSLRNGTIGINSLFEEEKLSMPDNKSTVLNFNLFDLQGNLINAGKGTASEFRNILNKHSDQISTSVFMMHIFSDDGKIRFSRKVLLEN